MTIAGALVALRERFFAAGTFVSRVFPFLAGTLLVPALALGQTFVQVNSNTTAVNATSVSVAYATAETAGDLNVVVVGWNDTSSSVISVVDDDGNNYALAGTNAGHGLSQAIYYAKNIQLTPNTTPTVTVTFNQSAGFPDVRVLEYSGLSATAPLDNWTGNAGVSTSADSSATVTSNNDLIFGAGTTASAFTSAGLGFTTRIITSPFGDIVEDSNAAQPAGTYNATSTVAAAAGWVMQVAGFSVIPVTFTNPPTISPTAPIAPASGTDVGGTSVTITGTNFQPGAVVLFGTAPGGISGVNCTEADGTTITCLTPASSDGAKDVTVINVDGQLSSAPAAYTFMNVTPTIGSITPATGPTNGGTAVTIAGGNFQVGANVIIDGLPAGNVTVQDNATITANTPGHPLGTADVTVNNPGGGTATSAGAFAYTLGTGPINYIQKGGAATGASTATVVGLLPNPQTGGNLNVVIIGWSDNVATVASVTDTEGNTYVAALPATAGTGLAQVIYYAKNIAGDGSPTPNQVTVTFSQAALAPDVQILEYSGLDVSTPIDTAAANFGSGLLADTGTCATTAPVDLIVAGSTVSGSVAGAGPGFNLLNITQPNEDGAEHQITSVPGSCEATMPLTSTSDWVIQTIALKAAPAPVPDFTISATPPTQTIVAGNAAPYTVSVAAVNGFNSPVILTCASVSLPVGVSCAFNPGTVTPGLTPATSALSISASAAAPVGTSSVTVTGTSGSVSHDTSVSLTVNAAPDYTIAASALSPSSVAAGGTATSSIIVTPLNGFNSTVNLTCSIAPVVTPAPTCAIMPGSITGGSGNAALTVTTSTTTPTGPYTVTVAGAGTVNHSTTVNFTVTAALVADFTITPSTLTPASVTAGGMATSTITIAPVNGFNATVNLTCSVAPAVSRPPTCSFSTAAITNGTGTSTLTVKTTAATTASLSPHSRGVFFAMLLPMGGLALLGTGFNSRRKKLRGFLLGCLLCLGLIFMAACGGSSSSGGNTQPGTPAGMYTVTVTGTSGATMHSTTVSLTVH